MSRRTAVSVPRFGFPLHVSWTATFHPTPVPYERAPSVEVSPLSREAKSEPLSAPLQGHVWRRPAFAFSTLLCPLSHRPLLRSGFLFLSGETSGLPSSVCYPKREVRSCLFPGFTTAVYGDRRTPYPVHVLFSPCVSASFACSHSRGLSAVHVRSPYSHRSLPTT